MLHAAIKAQDKPIDASTQPKKGEVREPMSVFRDSLRKPASRITLLLVTVGLLTYPIYCAFPTMKSVA